MNPQFVSKPILTDGARELIWSKVIEKGETIKAVSAELGVDINRVAAVVRLKEVEKDMIAKVRPKVARLPASLPRDLPAPYMMTASKKFD